MINTEKEHERVWRQKKIGIEIKIKIEIDENRNRNRCK